MSNLSKRVEKAKMLRTIPTINGDKGCYNVYGSSGHLYKVCLTSGQKSIVTPDGYRPTRVICTDCQKVDNPIPYQEDCEFCKGNKQYTVCYHCLGAIWFSMKSVDRQVSFYETYHDAVNGLNFGGKLAKIENQNGTGVVWCVHRKAGEKKESVKFSAFPPEQSLQKEIQL